MARDRAYVILLDVADYVSAKGIAWTEEGAIRACEKIAEEDGQLRRRFDDSNEWRSEVIFQKVLWYVQCEIVDGVLERLADIK